MANKKALLIGINRYKIPGADLRGCVNTDVRNMQSVLTKYFGFGDGDLALLTDYDATKRRYRPASSNCSKEPSRVMLLLHYSGHGANVPDKSGDEADHRDEILCPTDLNWYDPLLDDWLRATFDKLAAGVNLTVIMDLLPLRFQHACFFLPPDAPSIPRFLPCPLDLMAPNPAAGCVVRPAPCYVDQCGEPQEKRHRQRRYPGAPHHRMP